MKYTIRYYPTSDLTRIETKTVEADRFFYTGTSAQGGIAVTFVRDQKNVSMFSNVVSIESE